MERIEIPTLETDRLRLRPLRAGDYDDYAELHADPEVMRYPREIWDRGRSWRHLAFVMGHWQLGRPSMWAVEEKESGAFVGAGGFSEPEGWPGCELAGTLARRFWGRGYAVEAGRTLLDYAFGVLRKEEVVSLIHPDNDASIRVAEHLGEKLVTRMDHLGVEMFLYQIDREGYEATHRLAATHGIPLP